MLKEVFLSALVVVCITTASGFYYTEQTADQEFLVKQKKVYNLLYHTSQPNVVIKDLFKEGLDYSIEANIDSYTNKVRLDHQPLFHYYQFIYWFLYFRKQ